MLNNVKITRTTHFATGVRTITCEMFLTAPVEEYFKREIFPHFAEVAQGMHRPIGNQIQYYSFSLNDEYAFNQAVDQAVPFLQRQLKEINSTIVLVDDDPDDQDLVSNLLHEFSPESVIKSLNNGEELLQALQQWAVLPTLILLDLNMPRMNGLEALERIRTEERYRALPIIILTTSENPQHRQRAKELQANGYTIKPATINDFNRLILDIKQQWL